MDVDPLTYTISANELEKALARGCDYPIAAVVPVHLYGQAADLRTIRSLAAQYGVPIIEDCAQAHAALFEGKPVGSFGAFGCFSFYPTKNLGALGDAGIITTNDDRLAAKVKSLREYGWRDRSRVSERAGLNSRLDELQAAILRVKLIKLDACNDRRREIAARYDAGLSGTLVKIPFRSPHACHVFHQYVIRYPNRDVLRAKLSKAHIATNIHYAIPVHQQPAYRGRLLIGEGGLGCTERLAQEIISLPMFPQIMNEQLDYISDLIRRWCG